MPSGTKYAGKPIWKRRTKKGDRWDIAVYLGKDPETGRVEYHNETFESYGEAEGKVLEIKNRKNGGGPKPVSTTATLADWLSKWLDLHSTQVRSRTIAEYRGIVERWITHPPKKAPNLGKTRLRDLTVREFDALYLFMFQHGRRGKGLKPRSIRGTHVVLHKALKDAVTKGVLGHNPAHGVTIPKEDARAGKGSKAKKQVRAMAKEQVRRFLAGAREDRRYSALWHVLVLGGLRPCEAGALEWADVDWEAGAVTVEGSLVRKGVDTNRHPGGWELTAPKTESSNRTVPLPPVAIKELQAWRTQQKRDRLAAGAAWQTHDYDFVFTVENGAPLDLSNLRRFAFRQAMERAGLGVAGEVPEKKGTRGPAPTKRPFRPAYRIYDLRHTCASLLLSAGVDLKVVSERLGHKSITTTADIYGHLIDGMAQEPADKLEAMFGTG